MQGYQGDWPEDSHLENGNYWCKCVTCEADFIGHKRRVVCRECSTPKMSMRAAFRVYRWTLLVTWTAFAIYVMAKVGWL